jgi:cytoskeletal protein RodZ
MRETRQNVKSDFGRYLQRKRLAEGISLAEISKKTRIRVQTLLSLEKEEHHKLPADIYVKGLLRSVATVVGADGGKAVRRYEQSRKELSATAQIEIQLKKSGARSWLKLMYMLGLFFSLVTLSIYLMTWRSDDVSTKATFSNKGADTTNVLSDDERRLVSKKSASAIESGDRSETLTSIANNSTREVQTDIVSPGKDKKRQDTNAKTLRSTGEKGYLLSVQVVSDTWLKVIADNQEAVRYQLKTGDRLDLTASRRFNILIGNAKGVRLFVNDRPLPVSGRSGQTVNIDIP